MVNVQETQELNWITYAFLFDYRGISSYGKKKYPAFTQWSQMSS